MKQTIDFRSKLALCLCLGFLYSNQVQAQACNATPFACAVDLAIDNALQYSRGIEANSGILQDAQHNFLGILSFIEKKSTLNGRVIGYQGLDPQDQLLVNRLMLNAINGEGAFTNPQALPYSYVVGGGLMAFSAYLGTGGLDDVGANTTVTQAIANGVMALQDNQGSPNQPNNNGGWNYFSPEPDGDLSTTQFAVAGLSAASNIIDGAAATLPNVVNFLQAAQGVNGGLAYRPQSESSSSMTASGIWCYRLAQIPAAAPEPQNALSWLRQNYTYDRMVGPFLEQSTFYYMWAAEKALNVSKNDGLGGNIYAENFGDRNPALLGYPEEPPSAYFDYASTLLEWQDPQGAWGRGILGPTGWDEVSSHHFAILTLEKSLGGVCIDEDDDGLCGTDDNCPEIPNEDQLDEDNDGVGDVCDNCPKIANRNQSDQDGDQSGDACDRYICIPDGAGEICDGLDNDCDGFTDRNIDGSDIIAPESCATGLAGSCGVGHFECVLGGRIVCQSNAGIEIESCDLIDNDCDGNIDEGLINACGRCGPTPRERCDGVDNNCDGLIDEGENLCFGDEVCARIFGVCALQCSNNNDCQNGESCKQGFCVAPCDINRCPEGFDCEAETGRCIDPCEGITCLEGQLCFLGECVADNCYATGCPAQQACLNGTCMADPCLGINCGDNAFCREGSCVFSCANISCTFGEQCVDGECVSLSCGGVVCEAGQICQQSLCVADPCVADQCERGQVCINGSCATDPCWNIECPRNQACQVVNQSAQCVADWLPDPNEIYDMGVIVDMAVVDMMTLQDQGNTSDMMVVAKDMYQNQCEASYQECLAVAGEVAVLLEACQGQKDKCLGEIKVTKKDTGCQSNANGSSLFTLLCLLLLVLSRRNRSF